MVLPLACEINPPRPKANNVAMTSMGEIYARDCEQRGIESQMLQNCSHVKIQLQIIALGNLSSSCNKGGENQSWTISREHGPPDNGGPMAIHMVHIVMLTISGHAQARSLPGS